MLFGFDIGGTKTELTVMTQDYKIISRNRLFNKSNLRGNLDNIFALMEMSEVDKVSKIGFSLRGVIDPIHNRVLEGSIEWLNDEFFNTIQARYDCEIRLQNDAKSFALAESRAGAGIGYKTGFYIILGTGTGGGIVFDGKILDGQNNFAGEWGQIKFTPPEQYRKIFAEYNKKDLIYEDVLSGIAFTDLYNFMNKDCLQNPIEIMDRYRRKDKRALEYFDFYMDNLAYCLQGVVCILSPDVIVLGGGLSNVKEISANLWDYLKRYVIYTKPDIKNNALGDSAGGIGACLL